jgi:hypothetical protein
MKPISELKNIHNGHDLYVVASGASAGYIEQSFFNNKIAIGVNQVWKRFSNLDYIVRKESTWMDVTQAASKSMGFKTIMSRHNCGALGYGENDGGDYVFDHPDNAITKLDLDVIGTDKIVVSYSTITSAIHIAAYMGAANIVLIGHDCGTLDGQVNFPDYGEAIGGADFYRKFITQIEPQTLTLRERIKEVYGCPIYSLNPFINFGLEGHRYER